MGKASRFTTRQEIRSALVETLIDKTGVGSRVFPNRVIPVDVDELPVILIYPSAEDYTVLRKDPRLTHRRDLIISIQLIATDTDEIKMTECLDALSDEVEEAIENSDKLGGIVHDINIDTAQSTLAGEGQKPEGSWVMNYNVTYIKKPKE